MKPCEDYLPALSAFADGDLNEEEKIALLDHLERCEACRERLSELMILHTVFEELPELDAPDGFAERVLDRIHEDAPAMQKKPRRRALRTLAACAAVVLIAGAVWALPGVSLLGAASDNAAQYSDTNGAAAPEDSTAVADEDFGEDTYDSLLSDSVQYDAVYSGSAVYDDSESKMAEQDGASYLNVLVDDAAAAEFLAVNGMSVYAETEESVSFLVTPAVAHALAGESIVTAAEADALNGATGLMVVEIPKALPDTDDEESTSGDAEADGTDTTAPEDEPLPDGTPGENELPAEGEVAE